MPDLRIEGVVLSFGMPLDEIDELALEAHHAVAGHCVERLRLVVIVHQLVVILHGLLATAEAQGQQHKKKDYAPTRNRGGVITPCVSMRYVAYRVDS